MHIIYVVGQIVAFLLSVLFFFFFFFKFPSKCKYTLDMPVCLYTGATVFSSSLRKRLDV